MTCDRSQRDCVLVIFRNRSILDIALHDSVLELKRKFEAIEGISYRGRVHFLFCGKLLIEGNRTLARRGVSARSIIEGVFQPAQIFIKHLNGGVDTFIVGLMETVSDLKEKIHIVHHGIPPHR